jgi:O-antigen ligase
MVLAGSRANLLALTLQGGVVGWQKLSQLGTIKSWILRFAFVLVVIGSAGGIFQVIISEGGEQASLQEQVEQGRSSALVRAVMIYDGLRLFWESRGLGVGAGNVTYAESSQPYFGAENERIELYPLHNFPVQLAAQYGIVGLLLFGLTYFRLFFGLQRRRADPERETAVEIVRKSTWAFLVSFVLISISVSYLFDRRPFYFSFGIYLVANQYLIRRSLRQNQEMVAQ